MTRYSPCPFNGDQCYDRCSFRERCATGVGPHTIVPNKLADTPKAPTAVPVVDEKPMPNRSSIERYDADLDAMFKEATSYVFRIEQYLTDQYGIESGVGWRHDVYGARGKLADAQHGLRRFTRDRLDEREQLGNSAPETECLVSETSAPHKTVNPGPQTEGGE